MPTVPEQVSFDDFQVAIKPLLDLCGVNSMQTLIEMHFMPGDISRGVHTRVSFQVVASHEGVDDEDPAGFRMDDAPQPWAILTYPVAVDVMTSVEHECDGCEACEGVR